MSSAAEPGPPRGFARFLPPALAFGLSRLVLFASGMRALRGSERGERWSLDAWAHWDANHYLAIARKGYEFYSCAGTPGEPSWTWCGNTGWFPGYPLLLRPLIRVGLPPVPAAVALSGLLTYLLLLVLWTRWLGGEPRRAGLLALLIAAVAPGAVFLHAIFPISLLLLLTLLALDALLRERFLAAGLWGAMAAFTYPSGVLLAPVMVGHAILIRRARTAPRLLREALFPAALTAAGFGAVLAYHRFAVGDALAFFKVQSKYDLGLHWPQRVLLERLQPLASHGPLIPALQTLLVALGVLSVLATLLFVRREWSAAERLVALHLTVYWLLPLVLGGQLSLSRAEALLLPTVVWARRLPAPIQVALLGAFAFVAVRVGARYFQGTLM